MKGSKDWIKKHKKEIITGGALMAIGVMGGVYIYRARTYNRVLREKLSTTEQKCDTLMAAASEGLFEEAIATVTRKINYKKDRLEFIKQQLMSTPDDAQTKSALHQLANELDVLADRKNDFVTAQKVYSISLD